MQSRQKSNAHCSFVCRAADKVISRPADIFVLSGKSNADCSFELLEQAPAGRLESTAPLFYQMLTVAVGGFCFLKC